MPDLPASIPFAKFREAAAVLGINIKGVYRLTIDTEKVVVNRIVKDENGRTQIIGQHIARTEHVIPLSRGGDEPVVDMTKAADDGC